MLQEAGYPVEREHRVDAQHRLDLLVGRVGVEVKIAGGTSEVERQVRRYLHLKRLDGLVLVTNRHRHLSIEDERLEVVTIAGVSL